MRDARESADELFARGPHGVHNPRMWGWMHDHALPDGRWRIAPPPLVDRLASMADSAVDEGDVLLFVSQRVKRAHNAVRYNKPEDSHRDPVVAHINPIDAAARSIIDGTTVRVQSAAGAVLTRAELDDRMLPGSLSFTHGGAAPNAAELIGADADPLTGQPVFSAFAVIVTPVWDEPSIER